MSTAQHLHQTLAEPGAYEFLTALEKHGATAPPEAEAVGLMARLGVQDPSRMLLDLLAANVLQRLGEGVGLSTFGIRSLLLLGALNGGDVRAAYDRLSDYDSALRMYELVREGMTGSFLENINSRPGFGRLYFCSPWIALDERQRRLLVHAVAQSEARGSQPELIVVTRPAGGGAFSPPAGADPFRELGASMFLNPRLHTKLYIREPDRSGGYAMAIVGSQNLTKSRYLELGIRINSDGAMVNQLIAYFWELCNASVELRGAAHE